VGEHRVGTLGAGLTIDPRAASGPQELALQLSAGVKKFGGETVVADETGQRCPPWELQRAIRTARAKVDGLPEAFRYHDLRHFLSA
jgi:hypothetical protein